MFSLMQVSESAHGLVVSYPGWAPALFVVVAAAALAVTVCARARIRRRWPMSVAILLSTAAALYFGTFKATITDEAGSLYAFLVYDHSVRWKDATDIYLEQRSGGDWHIVVVDRQRRTFDFNVAELSIDDRDRVMAYMVDRMPRSAFKREPTLLKRRAHDGPRPVGLWGDQQT